MLFLIGVTLMKTGDIKIGHVISKLRYEKGYSQNELAQNIGLTKGAIGMYETDQRQPKYDILIKIADFFNVTTDYLLSHNNSDDSNTIIEDDPTVNKLLVVLSLLDEDNKDILLGKAKELLKQQQLEEKRDSIMPITKVK